MIINVKRQKTQRPKLAAPWPYFGGKSRVAPLIWRRLGTVDNYVEPFAGTLAVLLAAPWPSRRIETVNDKDGFIVNLWRAIAADPKGVAKAATWPVFESDLHARHLWLIKQRAELTQRLEGDPDYFDVKIAGWWVWGASCHIGGGWCVGDGPWTSVDGRLIKTQNKGISRKMPNRGRGVTRSMPSLSGTQGVTRSMPRAGDGVGVNRSDNLQAWMCQLQDRLRTVRVTCGEWDRILGPCITTLLGTTAVVLDPPYGGAGDEWSGGAYVSEDAAVAPAVESWCVKNERNQDLRIVLCGYESQYLHLNQEWTQVRWKATGGYGSQGETRGRENAGRECIWFSPSCPSLGGLSLFSDVDVETE